jgi:hypothetical protein
MKVAKWFFGRGRVMADCCSGVVWVSGFPWDVFERDEIPFQLPGLGEEWGRDSREMEELVHDFSMDGEAGSCPEHFLAFNQNGSARSPPSKF